MEEAKRRQELVLACADLVRLARKNGPRAEADDRAAKQIRDCKGMYGPDADRDGFEEAVLWEVARAA